MIGLVALTAFHPSAQAPNAGAKAQYRDVQRFVAEFSVPSSTPSWLEIHFYTVGSDVGHLQPISTRC